VVVDLIDKLLAKSAGDAAEAKKRASPITYASKDDPPFLLFHGTKDELVPVDQARRFADKLQQAGVSVDLVIEEGEGHGFSKEAIAHAIPRMHEFLKQELVEKSKQ